jgi:hypothetical protein
LGLSKPDIIDQELPMIIEVNDAGEILVPAELVQAAPHTRLNADREGDSVVLKPLAERPRERGHRLVDALPILHGRLADPAMTFRREDIYGPDAR